MKVLARLYEVSKFGARGPKVHELPLVVQMEYGIQWQRKPMDLTELAHKSRVQGWSNEELGEFYGRSPVTIRITLSELDAYSPKVPPRL